MATSQREAAAGTTLDDGRAARAALHRLVDELPDRDLLEAARRLDDLVAGSDPQAQVLIERWIRPHPHHSNPADAVLAESSVPVYALIGHLPVAQGDLDQVADAYEVPREAVEAALAYYRRNRAAIDARIYTGE
jgi:uncharacterized protein (DUF433 family)